MVTVENRMALSAVTANLNDGVLHLLKTHEYSPDQKKSLLASNVVLSFVGKIPVPKMTVKFSVPHRPLGISVCVIVKDMRGKDYEASSVIWKSMWQKDLSKHGTINLPPVTFLPISELKLAYQSFEARRKLAATFDVFLADKRVAHDILPKWPGGLKTLRSIYVRGSGPSIPLYFDEFEVPQEAAVENLESLGKTRSTPLRSSLSSRGDVSPELRLLSKYLTKGSPKLPVNAILEAAKSLPLSDVDVGSLFGNTSHIAKKLKSAKKVANTEKHSTIILCMLYVSETTLAIK
ncbi:unnamed protein product [Dibothriocephalus latus]|uniref:Uncharacterized protein n=1 Tax=Dibothriocephalus latus TaxID=60516 RepID=A0A3P6TEP8_DIBLA|nr:unnamed protein product [Dibothriocephalus latus]